MWEGHFQADGRPDCRYFDEASRQNEDSAAGTDCKRKKGRACQDFKDAKKSGYVRVRIDGNLYDLSEEIQLEKNKKHNIEIIVDRLMIKEGIENRLTDSIETVMKLTGGILLVDVVGKEQLNFSQSFSCPTVGISIDEIEPRSFLLIIRLVPVRSVMDLV